MGLGALPLTQCGSILEDPQSIKKTGLMGCKSHGLERARWPRAEVLKTGGGSKPCPSELGHLNSRKKKAEQSPWRE